MTNTKPNYFAAITNEETGIDHTGNSLMKVKIEFVVAAHDNNHEPRAYVNQFIDDLSEFVEKHQQFDEKEAE